MNEQETVYYNQGFKAGLQSLKSDPTFYYELANWAAETAKNIDSTVLSKVISIREDYTSRGSSANGFDEGTTIDKQFQKIVTAVGTAVNELEVLSRLVKSTST